MTPRSILLTLLSLDLIVVIAHAAGFAVRGEAFLFLDMDAEANLPTWYSSIKFAMCGTLLGLLAVTGRVRQPTPLLLSLLFMTFSLDEVASIHERIGRVFADHLLPSLQMRRKDAFLWPLFLGLPAVAANTMVLKKLMRERYFSPQVWSRFALALGLFFSGAVGFEILAFNPVWVVLPQSPGYWWLAAIEETLEQAGASLLVWASLSALVERREDLPLWLRGSGQTASERQVREN